jgi:hypothetical protein
MTLPTASVAEGLNLDLRISTLARACKGNVEGLPSFMVHDDPLWPTFSRVQLDSRNRIHIRRTTFLQVVCTQVPVREGIWHGMGVQEFHIDLKPHHLQGSQDAPDPQGYKHSREITKTDAEGRNPGDPDYGYPTRRVDPGEQEPALALGELAPDGPRRAVRSTVFDGVGSED